METGDPDPVELEQKTPSASRKRGRKPIPANIPREIVTIDLPAEKKFCGCGASLIKIGEEITEKLLLVPAKIVVLRIVRPQYACKHCEGTEDNRPGVIIAPMPPQIVKHGIVTPSLLTYIIMNKFHDALPLYRQSRMLERMSILISRSTVSNWILEAARAYVPLHNRLCFHLRQSPAINMDETPVQVMNEPERKNTTTSFMWVACGGQPGRSIVLFTYSLVQAGKPGPFWMASTVFSRPMATRGTVGKR